MKIGLLITSMNNFGKKGFYNSQEIGLAKELDKLFDGVIIYKLTHQTERYATERVVHCNQTVLKLIPSKSIGINGLLSLKYLDTDIDALIYFSDTQLMVPKVYKWCKKYDIKLIPYIGVTESHSNSKIKKTIIDIMFKRNVEIYKKCTCMVKTPQVAKKLKEYDVVHCEVAPVGLDLSILHTKYTETSIETLKEKWGFERSDKILLFVGRLVSEKQPVKLIEIFEQIHKKDSNHKLIIIGTGLLLENIKSLILKKRLSNSIKIIEKIPNTDIWQLYKISKAFINLNHQEIFGMAILEAMYYECKVIAWKAPGPNFIIEHGKNGILCESDKDLVEEALKEDNAMGKASHTRVIERFTWKATANVIEGIVG
ncbi:glycosyl transferase family 1 [Priestia megaterium]|nr:glycosyl transferase family 1 [Priestia megaterium]